MKLRFSKTSEHSERCFVNFFDRSAYNFWRDTFNFCSFRSDYLIDSLLCDFIYFSSCLTDNFWSDFPNLIYSVSTGVREVVPIEKTSCLAAIFSFEVVLPTLRSVFGSIIIWAFCLFLPPARGFLFCNIVYIEVVCLE